MNAPAAQIDRLSGWGRFPRADCAQSFARDEGQVRAAVLACDSLIARGLGRAG